MKISYILDNGKKFSITRKSKLVGELETLFENNNIKVETTGRNYDFMACITNKTNQDMNIFVNNEYNTHLFIGGDDWTGLVYGNESIDVLYHLVNGNYDLIYGSTF